MTQDTTAKPTLQAEDMDLIRRLFFPRTDVHPEMYRAKDGRVGYSPSCSSKWDRSLCLLVDKQGKCKDCEHFAPVSLSEERLRSHLQGKVTLGTYITNADGQTHLFCLDIDIKKEALETGQIDFYRQRAQEQAANLLRRAAHHGLNMYLEDSGNRGYHAWGFLDSSIPSWKVKALGNWLVGQLEEYEGIEVEINPKQGETPGKYGNLVKLPFGKHLKTNRRCYFVDPETMEMHVDQQLSILRSIKTTPVQTIEELFSENDILPPSRNNNHANSMKPKTYPLADFDALLEGCGFLKHCKRTATTLLEPAWHSLINLLAFCEDGDQHAHELSVPYPGYTPEETDQKLESARAAIREGIGPHTCEYICSHDGAKAFCPSCRYFGMGLSPYYLGRPAEEAERRKADEWPLSDTVNAERFARQHGDDVRYCYAEGRWYYWTGKKWTADDCGELERRAKSTARSWLADSANEADDARRRMLIKHAEYSLSGKGRREMLRLAESEEGMAIRGEGFDALPNLLCADNGTVDLRTGSLHPHQREHFITKQVAFEYNPTARCPTFLAFLRRIFNGDEELIRFVVKAIGYSLTADTSERCLFILHGSGRNGKSTLLLLLLALLGEYAVRTPTATLMARRGDSVPNDVARLRGVRFVAAAETDEGRKLAEALVKDLTGQDRVSARFMRSEWFDFEPVCKIWLATNHRPEIAGTDPAIWDRIREIPFQVRIPDSEVDPYLLDKLKAELPGIFTLAVQGAVEWHKNRLGMPPAVKNATDRYRAEMDTLGRFLDECCVIDHRASVRATPLYEAYRAWCGHDAVTQKAFGKLLGERGLISDRKGSGVYWLGIGLLATLEEAKQAS